MQALRVVPILVLSLFFAAPLMAQQSPVAIVIHGGAGTIKKENLSDAQEAAYREKLREAVRAGHMVLNDGGDSLDAVTRAINILEDSPLFNAGKGAVFTNAGENELDASIMRGDTLNAGAVTGVKHVRNPILLARKVMEESRHVLLSGSGAEEFGRAQGIDMVEQGYFRTEHRWEQLQEAKEKDSYGLDPREEGEDEADASGDKEAAAGNGSDDSFFSTVGAVAIDRNGKIAAGTSTGGQTNKRYGRIGDSPIIGAGTYANNETGGFSGTGNGEFFLRQLATHDVHALMAYQGLSMEEAMNRVVEKLLDMGAGAGLIGLDKEGNIKAVFNTEGMYRAWVDKSGDTTVRIYGDE
jgi:beta-aspartyl-peptidase (threonine type)